MAEATENYGGNKRILEPILGGNVTATTGLGMNGPQRDLTKSGNLHAPNMAYDASNVA